MDLSRRLKARKVNKLLYFVQTSLHLSLSFFCSCSFFFFFRFAVSFFSLHAGKEIRTWSSNHASDWALCKLLLLNTTTTSITSSSSSSSLFSPVFCFPPFPLFLSSLQSARTQKECGCCLSVYFSISLSSISRSRCRFSGTACSLAEGFSSVSVSLRLLFLRLLFRPDLSI